MHATLMAIRFFSLVMMSQLFFVIVVVTPPVENAEQGLNLLLRQQPQLHAEEVGELLPLDGTRPVHIKSKATHARWEDL